MADYTYRERCSCGAEIEVGSSFGITDAAYGLDKWRDRHSVCPPKLDRVTKEQVAPPPEPFERPVNKG